MAFFRCKEKSEEDVPGGTGRNGWYASPVNIYVTRSQIQYSCNGSRIWVGRYKWYSGTASTYDYLIVSSADPNFELYINGNLISGTKNTYVSQDGRTYYYLTSGVASSGGGGYWYANSPWGDNMTEFMSTTAALQALWG